MNSIAEMRAKNVRGSAASVAKRSLQKRLDTFLPIEDE